MLFKRGQALAAWALLAGAAHGQAIERHLPPAEIPGPPAAAAPVPVPKADARPLGPALLGVVILDQNEPLQPIGTGVRSSSALRLRQGTIKRLLRPFLGQPVSRALIQRIEATIVGAYRRAGYPFVALSAPEQEITTGVLQLRVAEFKLGAVRVVGSRHADELMRQLRVSPGEMIDADRLSQDLDWLNRYPFRTVEPVVSPGQDAGVTDLTLKVTERRPFSLHATYSNSGSAGATWDRYSLGGSVGGIVVPGSLISYEFTASPDFFWGGQTLFGNTGHPRYISHGLRFVLPTNPRGDFEGSFDFILTNRSHSPFDVHEGIEELNLGERQALSNFVGLPGEINWGVEIKRLDRTTAFGGVNVLEGKEELFQGFAGYMAAWSDGAGASSLAVVAHVSPGGVNALDSTANLQNFTNGRVLSSRYAYVSLSGSRSIRLPAQWLLSSVVQAQYAFSALPETEQGALGSQGLVRGYSLDDGSYDTSFVLRNQLRAPLLAVPSHLGHASPFAFVDYGHGTTRGAPHAFDIGSLGVGVDYQIGHLSIGMDAAVALKSAAYTRARNGRFEIQSTLAF